VAQIRASEPSTVTQTIDGTEFTIDYYRPRARGRSPLWGHDAVIWEHTWTPGANWATTLEFQKPIQFEGVSLEPGKYSLWMEMSEEEFLPETLILDPGPRLFHTTPPQPRDEQIRVPVKNVISDAPHTEILTWGFDEISSTGGTLALRWGTVRVPFEVRVESSMRLTVTEEEAAPVLGTFEMQMQAPDGQMSPPFSIMFSLGEDQHLHGDIEGMRDPSDGSGEWFNNLDMWLLPMAHRIFAPSEAYDGVLWEVWNGYYFEFELTEDKADSFQLRGPEDVVAGGGQRVQ
jgi:hypothetical protein